MLHADGQPGEHPRQQSGIPCILVRASHDARERCQFFMGNLPVFAFPALHQRRVRHYFDAIMLAHFDDFAPGFVVCADILCNLFRLFALGGMETRFGIHPPGFNHNNQ